MRAMIAVLLLVMPVSVAQAAVLTVTNTGDTGSGCLRDCIAVAQPGDEIRFDESLDGRRIVLTNGQLVIDKGLTITGRGFEKTVLDGDDASRVLFVSASSNVHISGVTITGGNTHDMWDTTGGGIRNEGTLTLSRCVIRDNYASSPYFSGYGGGIYNAGTLTVDQSTISGNRTSWGWFSAPEGGGILNNGILTVNRSTISGNRAGYGGGISSRFSGDAVVTIRDSTISSNLVAEGIRANFVSVRNSILGGGCAIHGTLISLGHNLADTGNCRLDQPSDQPDTEPMLGPLQDNAGPTWTHVPLEGSPLIDRGWCDPGQDQRGVPRPLDGNADNVAICDIGAVEYVPDCDEPERPCDDRFEVIGPGGEVIVIQNDSDG